VQINSAKDLIVYKKAYDLADDWFDAPGVSSDFTTERKQPEDQIRETL